MTQKDTSSTEFPVLTKKKLQLRLKKSNKFNMAGLRETNRDEKISANHKGRVGFPPLGITRWVRLLGCANRNRAGWRKHNIDTVPSQKRGLCVYVAEELDTNTEGGEFMFILHLVVKNFKKKIQFSGF